VIVVLGAETEIAEISLPPPWARTVVTLSFDCEVAVGQPFVYAYVTGREHINSGVVGPDPSRHSTLC
jgi:hypothetical protein